MMRPMNLSNEFPGFLRELENSPRSVVHYSVPSLAEQTGIDPVSKLAAAIERLCDILESPPACKGAA